MKKLKTIFCGTPEFAFPTLDALVKDVRVDLRFVITPLDRPYGRGQKLSSPPVARFAKERCLNLFQTENLNKEDEFLEKLQDENIDLIIVLAFSQFLSEKVLKISRLGAFNIHASLLPKYRGASPIQYAILNGETQTGISIQKMVKKMDAGDIVLSIPVEIAKIDTGGDLSKKLESSSALAVLKFITKISEGKIDYIKQDENEVSFAPKILKNDEILNFKETSAENILNRVRAFLPRPGTYFYFDEKRIKALKVSLAPNIINETLSLSPGDFSLTKNGFYVKTLDVLLRLERIMPEGKKEISDSDFYNGQRGQKK